MTLRQRSSGMFAAAAGGLWLTAAAGFAAPEAGAAAVPGAEAGGDGATAEQDSLAGEHVIRPLRLGIFEGADAGWAAWKVRKVADAWAGEASPRSATGVEVVMAAGRGSELDADVIVISPSEHAELADAEAWRPVLAVETIGGVADRFVLITRAGANPATWSAPALLHALPPAEAEPVARWARSVLFPDNDVDEPPPDGDEGDRERLDAEREASADAAAPGNGEDEAAADPSEALPEMFVDWVDRPLRALLPVFFNQADACVLERSVFEANAALNPQLRDRLRVAATSPEIPARLVFVSAGLPKSRQHDAEALVKDLSSSIRGSELMAALGWRGIRPVTPALVEGFLAASGSLRETGDEAVVHAAEQSKSGEPRRAGR